MVGYVDIKNHLEAHSQDSIGQFGIDWIEDELERYTVREEANSFIDDEEARRAMHYTVDNVLEVMREDARCRPFFLGFKQLLEAK
jgi:hypothetical protein